MNVEIGSEFWLQAKDNLNSQKTFLENSDKYLFRNNGQFVLSGRTAIDLIIQDLSASDTIKNVYIPAYCCESMVFPFTRRNVKVFFYENLDEIEEKEVSVLYVNNYFGYPSQIDLSLLLRMQEGGTKILYDRTHALFLRNDAIHEVADYSFCSIRKWLPIPAGAVVEKRQSWTIPMDLKPYPYIQLRIDAMQLKSEYISGNFNMDKNQFFSLYSDFGHHLVDEYINFDIDSLSLSILKELDFVKIKNQRIENALIIRQGLKNIAEFCFWGVEDNNCHPYIPIFCRNRDERDDLRRYLIDHQIYCPIHWPKGWWLVDNYLKSNKLIDCELSLICDQRYGSDDMGRMVETINNFYN